MTEKSFTDLEVPLSGIPIQVIRRYDTLDVNQQDDFSYGWRLEFRDTNLRTNLGPDEVKEELGIPTVGFREGQKVYLTEPGGKRVGFTFTAKHDPLNRFLLSASAGNATAGIYYPQFIPDKGVKSKLEIDSSNVKLQVLADGRYVSLGTGIPYNPADPTFGKNLYTLTMKNGIKYTIDGFSGDLLTAADTNGNQLTYSESEIVSNSGVKVTFGRDGLGRITSVTDPAGESLTYSYTGNDLTSVTDREQNTTQFTYHSTRPHFMKEVIDPLGRTGLKVEYDEAGRMKRLIDPEGNPVELTYNPEESIQIVQDAYNFPTIYKYDSRGNVIQQTNAEGQSTTLQYDGDDNLSQITDPNGSITTYGYNGFGDLLWRTDPHAPGDPNTTTTRYTYNAYGQNMFIKIK